MLGDGFELGVDFVEEEMGTFFGFGVLSEVEGWSYEELFFGGEESSEVEGGVGLFFPLVVHVADPSKPLHGDAPQFASGEFLESLDGGVPDWSAEVEFDSLPAGVDGDPYRCPLRGIDEAQGGVQGLEGEATVVLDGELLVSVHGFSGMGHGDSYTARRDFPSQYTNERLSAT